MRVRLLRQREQVANAGMTCPACASRAVNHAFWLSRGEVTSCSACGLEASQDDTVDELQDSQFHRDLDAATYVGYFEPFRSAQYRLVLGRLELQPGLRLLDVGASFGWMLAVGAELGLDCYGLEPSPMSYRREVAGRIRRATLREYASRTDERFDVITVWHVLEHLRDPFAALGDIRDLLEPSGRAVIAVPNAAGRLYRIGSLLARRLGSTRLMEELWYTHNPNMHRYYPTPPSLARMLTTSGLDVVDSFTLEAFDWRTIWTRGSDPARRFLLRLAGPAIARSQLTAAENLVMIAQRA